MSQKRQLLSQNGAKSKAQNSPGSSESEDYWQLHPEKRPNDSNKDSNKGSNNKKNKPKDTSNKEVQKQSSKAIMTSISNDDDTEVLMSTYSLSALGQLFTKWPNYL